MARYRDLEKVRSYDKNKERFVINNEIDGINYDDIIFYNNSDRINLDLFSIAREYYGSPTLWWIIAKANNLKLPYNVDIPLLKIPKNPNIVVYRVK